jgi:hypothetical protein
MNIGTVYVVLALVSGFQLLLVLALWWWFSS